MSNPLHGRNHLSFVTGSAKKYRIALLAAVMAMAGSAYAADAATGTVTGRVLNVTNGQYLSKAVVSVEGTNIQVLTNDFGEYTISNAPAGSIKLKVSYTGQETQTVSVAVDAGASATKNVSLGGSTSASGEDKAIVLDVFKVESQRYKNAQEIAINEERNSVSIKSVVATDSMGFVQDGNVGDFVKFLPGIEVDSGGTYTNGADTSFISVRGFGPENTAITIDGMPVSSPSPSGLTRAVSIDMLSINNASRIEVIKVATPDMPSDSPGGSINLVTRSAFEYAKPSYSLDLSATMNTLETSVFSKKPGPANEETYHTLPNGRFSVSIPITKKLGFSVSVASDNKYAPNYKQAASWQQTSVSYSGSAITNSVGAAALNNPYLKQVSITDNPWNTFKNSGNFKVDWKPFPGLTLSANYQYSAYTGNEVARRLQFSPGSPNDWSDNYVYGRFYSTTTTTNPGNKAAMNIDARDKTGATTSAYFKATYSRGPWQIDGNVSRSVARGHYEDMNNGHFSGIDMKFDPGQVLLEGIDNGVVGKITTKDRSGNVIDYTQLSNWVVDGTLTAKSGEALQKDLNDSYGVNVRRELDFLPFNLAVKTGWAGTMKMQKKWGRGTGYQMRYVGPTLTSTDILDQVYYVRPADQFANQQWVDVYRLYDLYKANPSYFDPNYDYSTQINNYVSATNQTKKLKESSDSFYGQIEAKFFNNRLSIVTGVRQKQSKVAGYQPTVDSKYNYVKNADGTLYTDSIYTGGVRIDGGTTTTTAGTSSPTAVISDTALIARMRAAGAIFPDHVMWANNGATVGTAGSNSTNLELAARRLYISTLKRARKEPKTPSFITSYKLTPQLDVQVSWSRESQLVNLESATTTGILTATNSFTINENVTPTGALGGDGTISTSNPGLKPKQTDSYNIQLRYYTKKGGLFSLGYYYKQIKNEWETTSVYNTSSDYASILESLGLDTTTYADWTLNTTTNGLGKSKKTGFEAEVRQNLGILGSWGQYFDAFASYSRKESSKVTITDNVLGQLQPAPVVTASAGLAFNKSRWSVQTRALFKQSYYTKYGTVSYNGATYQLYTDTPDDLKVNLELGYRLSKNYSLFLSGSNVLNSQRVTRVYDPITKVAPVYSYVTSVTDYGVSWVFGIHGSW